MFWDYFWIIPIRPRTSPLCFQGSLSILVGKVRELLLPKSSQGGDCVEGLIVRLDAQTFSMDQSQTMFWRQRAMLQVLVKTRIKVIFFRRLGTHWGLWHQAHNPMKGNNMKTGFGICYSIAYPNVALLGDKLGCWALCQMVSTFQGRKESQFLKKKNLSALCLLTPEFFLSGAFGNGISICGKLHVSGEHFIRRMLMDLALLDFSWALDTAFRSLSLSLSDVCGVKG